MVEFSKNQITFQNYSKTIEQVLTLSFVKVENVFEYDDKENESEWKWWKRQFKSILLICLHHKQAQHSEKQLNCQM